MLRYLFIAVCTYSCAVPADGKLAATISAGGSAEEPADEGGAMAEEETAMAEEPADEGAAIGGEPDDDGAAMAEGIDLPNIEVPDSVPGYAYRDNCYPHETFAWDGPGEGGFGLEEVPRGRLTPELLRLVGEHKGANCSASLSFDNDENTFRARVNDIRLEFAGVWCGEYNWGTACTGGDFIIFFFQHGIEVRRFVNPLNARDCSMSLVTSCKTRLDIEVPWNIGQ
jgi:hypothetical protein